MTRRNYPDRVIVDNDGDDIAESKQDALRTIGGRFTGHPEIRADNEGWGQWENTALQAKFKDSHDINRQFRYGNWAVHLNGGPQASSESWATISIPVNEMVVSDLVRLEYPWYTHVTGTSHIGRLGPSVVISAYDKDDHSKRVDFNTYAVDNASTDPQTAGWHEYLMTSTDATERVYWYGNNTGTHDEVPTEGGDYYWSNYVADNIFKDWVIYRIHINFGYWGSTRSTGDVWIAGCKINGIPVDWEPSEAEKTELLAKERDMFGTPSLVSRGNGIARWMRGSTSPFDQKGQTGWLAELYGGVQSSWDDWARLSIPVNEMRVPDLKTALWSYYMTETEAMGVNMVIWVHDPFNFDNRAEITQQADIATLDKAAGWGAHELNPETAQFYFYGENTTKTNLTAGPANYYAWNHHTSTTSSFVTDELFNTWTIYRITFEYGWHTGDNEFKSAYVADVEINGQVIPLGPLNGKHRKTVLQTKTLEAEGAYSADDVISESDTNGVGTDWDFDFGGTGYITKAVLAHATNANTARVHLFLYDYPPTCELDDHAASNGPITADISHFLGVIEFPAMTDTGTGHSYSVATPSTVGNLPLEFDVPKIYGVAVTKDAIDFADDTLLSIHLTADMED